MAEPARRLLWVHQNFVSRAHAGNERAIYTIAGLLESGWIVDLVTGTTGYQGTVLPDSQCERHEDRLHWHRVRLPEEDFVGRRGIHYLSFMRRALEVARRLEPPDLVFVSTPPLPQTLLALRLAFGSRVPVVLEVRDLWPAFLETLGLVRGRAALGALAWMEAFAYRAADALVNASPAFRPYLEGFGLAPDLILDAPHGAPPRDVEGARRAGMAWREQKGLTDHTVLLYAGSLNESHGIGDVLEAAQATAHERIAWIVAGGGRGADRVRAAAGCLPNLRYLGALPRFDVDTLYGASDASIVVLEKHPIFASVMPGKLIDSLASAVPVICSVSGQAAALVTCAGAGWTCRSGGAALAQAAQVVAAAPTEERRRKGDAGRQFVRARCASESQARGIAQLCGEIADRGPGSRGRILRAAFGALGDALRDTSGRLVDSMYRDERGTPASKAFESWVARTSPQGEHRPLAVPALLDS